MRKVYHSATDISKNFNHPLRVPGENPPLPKSHQSATAAPQHFSHLIGFQKEKPPLSKNYHSATDISKNVNHPLRVPGEKPPLLKGHHNVTDAPQRFNHSMGHQGEMPRCPRVITVRQMRSNISITQRGFRGKAPAAQESWKCYKCTFNIVPTPQGLRTKLPLDTGHQSATNAPQTIHPPNGGLGGLEPCIDLPLKKNPWTQRLYDIIYHIISMIFDGVPKKVKWRRRRRRRSGSEQRK